MKIKITVSELKHLLNQQKEIVAKKLLSETYTYNTESTDGNLKSLPIDKEKFTLLEYDAKFPDDIQVLDRYLPKK